MEKSTVVPVKKKKAKKPNYFNRGPINPPAGWKETHHLPASMFRVIQR